MPSIPHPLSLKKFFGRLRQLRRRLGRKRFGSVLILVVALLVLMALIGTAFISTARTDRYATAYNGYNTQIDLLVDGVVALSQDAMGQGLMGQPAITPGPGGGFSTAFRPDRLDDLNGPGFHNWDCYDVATNNPAKPTQYGGDLFLASRIPENLNGSFGWKYCTVNPLGIANEAPVAGPAGPAGKVDAANRSYTQRTNLVPTSLLVTGSDGKARPYPALALSTAPSYGYLAGDTDWDGIADSPLFRLPIGTINGVTYYGSVRVIDNAAAINASMAMKPFQGEGQGAIPGNIFPTNIDLQGLLAPGDVNGGLNALTYYRHSGNAVDPNSPPPPMAYTTFEAGPSSGPGAKFNSPFEAIYVQLGSRLGNPAQWTGISVPGAADIRYRSLPLTESMALQSHFCLVSPEASKSILDTCLPASVYNSARRYPFAADQYNAWATLFNYPTSGGNPTGLPIRPLLVARNPVSNFAPGRFPDKGAWAGGTAYEFGDRVVAPDPIDGAKQRAYVCILPHSNKNPNDGTTGPVFWAIQPWTSHPTKISVNTGSFGQLWTAYWAVMSRAPNVGRTNPADTNSAQFRQTGHHENAPKLSARQMLQLRSALAAINTKALRDGTNDVPSRTITLTGGTPVTATVFGTKRQPYITEMMIDVPETNDRQYVAFELYNPSGVAVPLKPISMCYENRFQSRTAPGTLVKLVDFFPLSPAPMMPGERIIIENDKNLRPDDMKPILQQAEAGGIRFFAEKKLELLITVGTSELVLTRTRRGDGTPGTGNDAGKNAWDLYDEADPNNLVPLDHLDLTGIAISQDDKAHRWHYARPTDPAAAPWMCVYPGPYVSPRPAPNYCHYGIDQDPLGQDGKPMLTQGHLGLLKKQADIYPTQRPWTPKSYQLANRDAAGPNGPDVIGGSPVGYPYGGFTRNGDITAVTFIGSYTLRDAGQAGGPFREMMSPGLDYIWADDGDPSDDGVESIGRFIPIDNGPGKNDDDVTPQSLGGTTRYSFALDLWDYLDVYSPQQDYVPNLDPGDPTTNGQPTPGTGPKWLPAQPTPVANGSPITDQAKANNGREDSAPIEGRININTAHWRVLAAVPFFGADPAKNAKMAQDIVDYRDGNPNTGVTAHGPFHNLWELNKVPGFKTLNGTITGEPDDDQGDYSPFGQGATDGVPNDFETQVLAINRVSNLLTTRSDSFTAYIVVQGWRVNNTVTPPTADLVVQRRVAYIADRASVTPILQAGMAPGGTGAVQQRTPMNVVTVPNN